MFAGESIIYIFTWIFHILCHPCYQYTFNTKESENATYVSKLKLRVGVTNSMQDLCCVLGVS